MILGFTPRPKATPGEHGMPSMLSITCPPAPVLGSLEAGAVAQTLERGLAAFRRRSKRHPPRQVAQRVSERR